MHLHTGNSVRKLRVFLPLLLSVFVCATANAQFSTPMRDVDNPGKAPFQLFSEFNTQLPNGNSYTFLTSVPSTAAQRLVVDFFNIEINNLEGPVQTQGFVTLEVRNTATPTFPVFSIILPVTIINSTTLPGGNALAVYSGPVLVYVSAGQTLTFTAINLSGSSNMNMGASVTGHYVSIP
jgi:hypothetical protein